MSIILAISALLLLCSLSNVSAAPHNLTEVNTTSNIQKIIDNDKDSEVIITLADGNYSFSQINISRNVTIQGNSKNVKISGTGVLFNITASNVKLINLTITGFSTAVKSNSSGLTIEGCDISTSHVSINITSDGSDLKAINIKNNKINSSVNTRYYGAVYVFAPSGSINEISLIGNNITANNGSVSIGVSFDLWNCVNNLIFLNNKITGTEHGVYIDAADSNNTSIIFNNNNITATSSSINAKGIYLLIYGIKNSNISFNNNNITAISSGLSKGVELSASNINNANISFTKNNITATSSNSSLSIYPTAVDLSADYSKNVDISFTNNYISGTKPFAPPQTGYGVKMYVSCNNNISISFTNNNINGSSIGVDIYPSYYSNNTSIIFNNNNITKDVYLSARNSSNTNIIFTENNILGGYYGVKMELEDSKNPNISFTKNSIDGSYAVCLFADNSNNTTMTLTKNKITGYWGLFVSPSSKNLEMELIDNSIPGEYNYKVSLTDINSVVNSRVNLSATLTNGTSPLSGKKIDFYVNGKLVGSGITNSLGVATISYLTNTAGRFSWTAEYKDDKVKYNNNAFLNVGKGTTVVIMNNINGVYNSFVTLSATLNSGSSPVDSKRIDFYINNQFVGFGITNSLGVATFSYMVGATGILSVKATFDGDNDFMGNTKTNSLSVPILSELNIKNTALVKGKVAKITHTIANIGHNKGTFKLTFKLAKGLTYKKPKVNAGRVSWNKKTRTLTWIISNLKVHRTNSATITWNMRAKKGSYAMTPRLVKNNNIRLLSNNVLRFRVR